METAKEKQYYKMTKWPVSKLIITLGIPTTISMLVTNIYNMVDTFFVGQIGTSASGAVGIVFGLMAILQAFGFMFGHGSGSIISRKLGAGKAEEAGKYASAGFFYSIIVGILISVCGLLFLEPFMRLLGSTETILPYAKTYAVYILAAGPLMTSSCVLNNILRYEGKANFAMIGLIAGAVINMAGDPILMFGFHMGIAGAGLSTALSQVISFLILLIPFLNGGTQSRIRWNYFSKKPAVCLEIVQTGFPSLMRQGLSSISTMILNGQAGMFGDAAVAAMSIVNRISFFMFAVALGIGQGFQPVAAFNYGAKKYARVRKGYFFTLCLGEIFLGLTAILGMLLSSHLVGIFRNDPEVIEIGTLALRMQLVALFFQPLVVCSNMLFQSIGKNIRATIISMMRSGFYFIPTILILTRCFGMMGVEASQTVADILSFLTTIPFVVLYFRTLPKQDEETAEDRELEKYNN